MLNWKSITGCAVSINSDITKSEIIFNLPINVNQRDLEFDVIRLIKANNRITISELAIAVNQSKSSVDRMIKSLKENGTLARMGTPRNGYWKIIE